jgi:hypothetical protein
VRSRPLTTSAAQVAIRTAPRSVSASISSASGVYGVKLHVVAIATMTAAPRSSPADL